MTDTPPMFPPTAPFPTPGRAAARRFAAGVGLAVCVAATGCRGGGGFLAAKPAADPFAEAALAAASAVDDGDAGVVSLGDSSLGGGAVRTASAEFPAANSSSPSSAAGVTRVNPFAAPPVAATTSGDWLPGDGTDEPAEPAAAVVFAASDAAPAAATPPIPMDWAAEMAAFAGPDDGSADPFAAAPQSPPKSVAIAAAPAVAVARRRRRPACPPRPRVRPGRTSARPRVGRRPGPRSGPGDARGDPAAPPRRAGRDGDRGRTGRRRLALTASDGRGPVRALK